MGMSCSGPCWCVGCEQWVLGSGLQALEIGDRSNCSVASLVEQGHCASVIDGWWTYAGVFVFKQGLVVWALAVVGRAGW